MDTFYSKAVLSDLKSLKGWNFKWQDLPQDEYEIYKLTVKNDDRIQGLTAITDDPENKAVYVYIAEGAPHNIGENKEYFGVGGHLFAIAATRSLELGYGGFVYMDAKNEKLVNHYAKTLGAIYIGTPHIYRMAINEKAAKELIKLYNFRSDQL